MALAPMLAGCASLDEVRGDDLRIHIQADGPFRVGIPLPLDPDTGDAAWETALTSTFDAADLEVRDGWVWIRGNQTADVEARMRRIDAGANLQEASWDGTPRPIDGLPIVTDGPLHLLSVHWEATTCRGQDCDPPRDVTVCSLIFAASTTGLDAGLQMVPVRIDDLQCNAL